MVSSSRLFVALTPLLFAPVAAAGEYTFSTGAEYTTGEYGTGIDTAAWYVPFTLGYTAESFGWSLTVPYIRIDGSSLVTGIRSSAVRSPKGSSTIVTTTSEERVDSGLGDVTLSAVYQLQQETPAAPWMAVRGKIKFGTADEEKFLGTGENDYAIQFEAAKGIFDGFIGYNFLGDPDAIDYDDILYGAGAITLPLSQPWRTRTELYLEEAPLNGLDEVIELTLSFSRPLAINRHMNLYAVKGFTDSSVDWGVGAMVSHGF